MRKGGKDDDKGMISDIEGVRSLGGREMSSSIKDGICVCVAVVVVVVVALMVAIGLVVLMEEVGIVVLVIVVRVSCIGVVEVVGVLCIAVVEVDCAGVADILVLDEVFMVEVVEGVELVVRVVVECVVSLVLWCVNRREYFLSLFHLKSVEMNGLSVGGLLFGMVIWADCFVLLEHGFLGKMVVADVLMDVVVEVVVVEAVDVVQAGFSVFFPRGCLRDMVGVRVVIEDVIDAVVSTLGWKDIKHENETYADMFRLKSKSKMAKL